ncbi:MAG TPA: OB-fold domain-containing protein [Actinomycetota bacterium]|nr:OB-fold domain-containing protein [Actinomycetota bacterium]
MPGILSYGVYLPYHRLKREAIGAALGAPSGRGTRSVASYDEDATTMAVEAARNAVHDVRPTALYFGTSSPTYLDKTNATAIHAALGLDSSVAAFDMAGAVRSGAGALKAALQASSPTLCLRSDVRTGLPGGPDEREGGDGAVAFLCAPSGDFIVESLGGASATGEFLERWRLPGDRHSRVWEERFGEHAYVALADQAVAEGFKAAGVLPTEVDRLIVTGTHQRAVRTIARTTGVRTEAVVDDLTSVVGFTGAAHSALLLSSVLDVANPGETICVIHVADGVDVFFFRTTNAIAGYKRANTVADQIASTRDDLDYQKFLTWRGFLRREPPRRPDPLAPEAPPAYRYAPWKFSFTGSTCEACGMRHLPPQDVCAGCQAVRQMKPERMADVPGTITTFTIDRLAFSESPPKIAVVIDFDGGGRYRAELTDADPDTVAIGNRVEMTFRRLFESGGIVNYHWKARPIRGGN